MRLLRLNRFRESSTSYSTMSIRKVIPRSTTKPPAVCASAGYLLPITFSGPDASWTLLRPAPTPKVFDNSIECCRKTPGSKLRFSRSATEWLWPCAYRFSVGPTGQPLSVHPLRGPLGLGNGRSPHALASGPTGQPLSVHPLRGPLGLGNGRSPHA